MRFYHKLAVVAVLSAAIPAGAQPAPYVPPEQDVDDDYGQPQDGMPPPDPNAYAQAAQYGYMGPHPIPYDVGSGYCYQPGPHFHEYPPFDQYLFRESNGWFYFVGDPGDFGYAQQLWGYRGNHPIPAAYGGGYCFIDWPHRHAYPPPASMAFNFVGGYYAYAGPWDPWYWRWRPRYASYYGGYYRRSYYGGVYYSVRPPPIYRPRVVVGAPGVYRPGVAVVAPGGVRVMAPPPRAGVVVGAPPPRGYVGAPGRAVGAPPPRGYVGAPGRAVGAPPPRGYVGAPRPVGAPPPGRAVGAPPRAMGAAPVHGAPPARGAAGPHHR